MNRLKNPSQNTFFVSKVIGSLQLKAYDQKQWILFINSNLRRNLFEDCFCKFELEFIQYINERRNVIEFFFIRVESIPKSSISAIITTVLVQIR